MTPTRGPVLDPRHDTRTLAVALGIVRAGIRAPRLPSPYRKAVDGRSPLEASGWSDDDESD